VKLTSYSSIFQWSICCLHTGHDARMPNRNNKNTLLFSVPDLWRCGPGRTGSAMVPLPPQPIAVPAQIFENYRTRMRQHCAVPNALDVTRCLACRAPVTQTPGGSREHAKTGVCEACWDLLAPNPNQAVARCTRLAGAQACQYVAMWIAVNRVAPGGTLTCEPGLARHIIAVGTARDNPPNLWLPGQRP